MYALLILLFVLAVGINAAIGRFAAPRGPVRSAESGQ
jgi:hypothetical protein